MNPRIIFALALLCLSGCTTTPWVRKADLRSEVEAAESLEKTGPAELAAILSQLCAGLDYPHIGLPLHHVEVSNPSAMPPDASACSAGGRGQHCPGPEESGSDGVVPYSSSHLDGADSELIVRSGHDVVNNPAAIAEVIRIL